MGDLDNEKSVSVSARIPNALILAVIGAIGWGSFTIGTTTAPRIEAAGLQNCLNDAQHALDIAKGASARADTALQVRADHGGEMENVTGSVAAIQADLQRLRTDIAVRTASRYTQEHAAADRRQHEEEHNITAKRADARARDLDRVIKEVDWLMDTHIKSRREGEPPPGH